MELKIQTEIGQMTGVFESHPINCYQDYYVAWFKEKPSVIVQADTIEEAIEELNLSLHVILEFESEHPSL